MVSKSELIGVIHTAIARHVTIYRNTQSSTDDLSISRNSILFTSKISTFKQKKYQLNIMLSKLDRLLLNVCFFFFNSYFISFRTGPTLV